VICSSLNRRPLHVLFSFFGKEVALLQFDAVVENSDDVRGASRKSHIARPLQHDVSSNMPAVVASSAAPTIGGRQAYGLSLLFFDEWSQLTAFLGQLVPAGGPRSCQREARRVLRGIPGV
jgi:hypothetical protein